MTAFRRRYQPRGGWDLPATIASTLSWQGYSPPGDAFK